MTTIRRADTDSSATALRRTPWAIGSWALGGAGVAFLLIAAVAAMELRRRSRR
jgi:hypothetical protein